MKFDITSLCDYYTFMESITRYLALEQVGIWRHFVSKAHRASKLTVASVIYYLLNVYG
jgi:hypothetical protein